MSASSTNALRAAKNQLRTAMRQKLAILLPDDVHAQSVLATMQLIVMPEYQAAKSIGIYVSMPNGEVSTTALILDAFDRGKKVFVPYISRKEPIMDMLALKSREDFADLIPDKWGIPSIAKESVASRDNCLSTSPDQTGPEGLDLLVMPGVAFDERMRRLGHGKGYYDRFLSKYFETVGTTPLLVALALKEQVLPSNEEVPVGQEDWTVDRIVAGDGIPRTKQIDP